jgi:hypothetical protein
MHIYVKHANNINVVSTHPSGISKNLSASSQSSFTESLRIFLADRFHMCRVISLSSTSLAELARWTTLISVGMLTVISSAEILLHAFFTLSSIKVNSPFRRGAKTSSAGPASHSFVNTFLTTLHSESTKVRYRIWCSVLDGSVEGGVAKPLIISAI